jgi:hypothetical protein
LPAEFLKLRGKSIMVNIGKPISPDAARKAGSAGPVDLGGATTHVVLTPRDRLVPCAH